MRRIWIFVVLGLAACGSGGADRESGSASSSSSATVPTETRPDSSMYSPALTGESQGFRWQAMTATRGAQICLQVIGEMAPGVEPLADYPAELESDRASCVRHNRLEDARNAFIAPTTAYPLPGGVDGVWGLASPTVDRIEFALPEGTKTVQVTAGVFFVPVSATSRTVSLKVHRTSEPSLECEPVGALQDLTIYCR